MSVSKTGVSMGAGKLVISLDLELYWGRRRYHGKHKGRDELLSARRAVPTLLELFADYRVRATWPVVGFLFCQSRHELLDSLPGRLPAYRDAHTSPYAHLARVGETELQDPVHFAPSLVEAIARRPGQEVACHTFSNFHCHPEQRQLPQFEADLRAAIEVARRRGLILRSLAFPDNQTHPEYLDICQKLGISAYRGRPPCWPYHAADHQKPGGIARRLRNWVRTADTVVPLTGTARVADDIPTGRCPVNVPATRRFRPYAGRQRDWLARMQRRRMFAELDWAARNGGIFHLWAPVRDFGRGLSKLLEELRFLLERFDGWRRLGEMESLTMHEVVTTDRSQKEPKTVDRGSAG